eukprot:TRINITY_DN23747_c0_g1_i1.p1 TRINITY_DN23747_c0_g1~~TRINITY_DN23747_c0_g1_i1.p1  ORF type:complete len:255 (+),score=58.71 TRINITY_DN23747_c0_g1_i1:318-1082(+)
MADLVLDSRIRDWVLIPLTVVMILIGILRFFITKLTRTEQAVDLKALKQGQMVMRARLLRGAGGYIPLRSFRMRRHYFTNEDDGLLSTPKGAPAAAGPMMDPNAAVDMMKKNLSMIIPQTLTFAWVNFFFSGFVTARVPFPLTQRFRGMLQNGIDLSSVDVSYVSSRSWYFLNLLGLRGFISLILGEENAQDDAQKMMQAQMQMQMGGGMGSDPSKVLAGEKDGLELVQHEWQLPRAEERAVAALRQRLRTDLL